MATDKVTPMKLGEHRTIDGVAHVCIALSASERLAQVVGGSGCRGCPMCTDASGAACDELYLGHDTPLCGFESPKHTGTLRRVFPLTLVAELALAGVEFRTSDP